MKKPNLLPLAPEDAITDGIPNFGRYRGSPTRVNVDEFGRGGIWAGVASLRNRMRTKAWQHAAVFGPDMALTVAVVDAGLLTTAFASLVHGDSISSWVETGGPGRVTVPPTQTGTRLGWASKGLEVEFSNTGPLTYSVTIEAGPQGGRPGLAAKLVLEPMGTDVLPLSSVLRLPGGRPFYSLKGPTSAAGQVTLGNKTWELHSSSAVGLVDIHRALYPFHTWWKWATFATSLEDGTPLALNLTRNLKPPEPANNENALWVGDHLEGLGPAEFEVPELAGACWNMATADGSVSLVFEPFAERRSSQGLWPVASHYRQAFGLFSGTVVDSGGVRHTVNRVWGVTEDHDVHW